jgi:hypothetical protein
MNILRIFLFLGLTLFSIESFSQTTFNGNIDNLWSKSGNWSAGVPDASDAVTISSGETPIVDINANCASITFATGGSSSSLTVNSGITLNVTGKITINTPNNNDRVRQLIVGDGTVICNEISMSNPNSSRRKARISINDGLITINSTFTMSGNSSGENELVFTGSGMLVFNGATFGLGTNDLFTRGTGTIKLGRNGNQTLTPNITYHNIILASGGTKTITGTTINKLTIESGVSAVSGSGNLSINDTLRNEGSFNISSSSGSTIFAGYVVNNSTFTNTGNDGIEFRNGIENNGTFSVGNQLLTFTTNSQTLSGTSPIIFEGPISINSPVTINNFDSVLVPSTFTLSSGATWVNQSNSQLVLKDNFTITGTLNCNASNNSVYFSSTSAQTIPNINYQNLIINGNSTKTLDGNTTVNGTLTLANGTLALDGYTLTLNGNVNSASGVLKGSTISNIVIGGNAPTATLKFDQTDRSSRSLSKLTSSRTNGVNITDTLEIIDSIIVSNGTINSNGNMILISDANNTAGISRITSGGISGNITVQRFIPGGNNKRKWRFLSFPVNNSNGGIPISEFIDDIHVTGTGASANGFDECGGCGASLKTYNESVSGSANNGWTNPASINTEIPTGLGFEVFVRGDRNTVQNPFSGSSIPTDVTIDFTGLVNSGNYTFNLSYTNSGNSGDGFNLVANPYPSAIDWVASTGWTRSNINVHAYVYDANTGSYGTVSTSGATTGASGISRYIPLGQSFFVKANAANPSISMTEAVKTSNIPFNFFKSAQSSSQEIAYVKFKLTAPNYEDNLVVRLDSTASDSVKDTDDAFKLFNDRLNFYTRSKENINLAINHYPYPDSVTVEDTINISVFSYNDSSIEYRTHTIELVENENIDSDIIFDLLDNYTNERINISELGTYSFDIDSNATSYGNNRFKLIIYRLAAGIESAKNNKIITVYPNPANDKLYIRTKSNIEEEVIVSIEDLQGKELLRVKRVMNSEESYIQLKDISEGLYFLKIHSKNGTEAHKILIKH